VPARARVPGPEVQPLEDLADGHPLVDEPAVERAHELGLGLVDLEPPAGAIAAGEVAIAVGRAAADEPAGAGLLELATAEALTQERALVLGDRALDLQEELVAGIVGDAVAEELDRAAGAAELLQDQRLVGILAGEPVGAEHRDDVDLGIADGVAQCVEAGPVEPGDHVNLGYFTEWGVYGRGYHVKNILTSGSAEKLTHINYAFGDVRGGECVMGDSYAAVERAYTAAESVSGQADTWDQPLRGNFNQLLQLKERYPHLKVLWSFGGWTWSGGFGEAMQDPERFARSCYELVNDPRWEGVFDGIDLDWEYPNACGLTCDDSGREVFGDMMKAFRGAFGDQLVTAAITADASPGGKIDAADYGYGAQHADYIAVMTYDFFGAWAAQGPTAPHSALTAYPGIPQEGFTTDDAVQKLTAQGVPEHKLLLGVGFYGRGWTGVTQSEPGGSATGPASGTYEPGIEDYKVLKETCPATGVIAGTAYAHCGTDWWSYDTPETIRAKMAYAKDQGLGGAFFWELHGDTADGELITAIHEGLR
jgi:chitinase